MSEITVTINTNLYCAQFTTFIEKLKSSGSNSTINQCIYSQQPKLNLSTSRRDDLLYNILQQTVIYLIELKMKYEYENVSNNNMTKLDPITSYHKFINKENSLQ